MFSLFMLFITTTKQTKVIITRSLLFIQC